MKTVNMQAAKTQLSRLVEDALNGEEIILARAGKPQVILTRYRPSNRPRRGGQLAESLKDIPSDFDRPDPQIKKLFEGGSPDPIRPGRNRQVFK